jgi:signal transduction histidine kinase
MMLPAGLRARLTVALLFYLVVVTLVVAAHGYIVNERAELLVWQSLLQSELAHFNKRHAADPAYRWTDTETLKLYGPLTGHPVPTAFATLPPGVHDEVPTSDGQFVVLVSGPEHGSGVLALDISAIERSEQSLTATMTAAIAAVVALLALVTYAGVGWLVRPLSSMARTISSFAPDRVGQRLVVERSAPHEARVIADSLNQYLQRLDQFVERERAFVNVASHELRTPIAVMSGSAEVALDLDSTAAATVPHLERILRTARDLERLVTLLVALAKDPARLRAADETVELSELLPSIVADHEFLARRKELWFELDVARLISVRAPAQIVRAAIGNLVRNAIENSDRGMIRIATAEGARVIIADPGHGMSDDEMSALYTRMARSGETMGGAGIGIELISRICEHLGWRLSLISAPREGTTATLDLGASDRRQEAPSARKRESHFAAPVRKKVASD